MGNIRKRIAVIALADAVAFLIIDFTFGNILFQLSEEKKPIIVIIMVKNGNW